MIKKLLVLQIILIISINVSLSQSLTSNIKYQLETGIYLSSSGKTPFWLRSNQYGVIPLESQFATFRGSAHKEYDSTKNENKKLKKFSIGYGTWAVANVGKVNQLLLPEAYIKVRYGVFEFYGGRRREIIGLVDTSLTSGSYIWSGNAMPIPKIQVSIPNYISIIGHGLFSIKGSFAHGWFGEQTYAQNYYLHQKYLYGRVGKPNAKVHFYSGFNHQIQWGGYVPSLINDPFSSQNGFLPSDFNTLLSAAFPFPFIRKAFPSKIKLGYDNTNYGGNQLGSIDFATEIKIKQMRLLLYRQLPYELGSLFSGLINADDGLYGISLKLHNPVLSINRIVIEGFHSNNQGQYRSGVARLLNLKDNHFGEIHNYLNHGQYIDGWSYNDIGIGTPTILNNNELAHSNYNKKEYYFSYFNNVRSIFVAVNGNIAKLNYGVKYNYSIYRTISQSSLTMFSNLYISKGYCIRLSLAADRGKLLNNNSGFFLSIQKNWY